jgi:hypothetical protein
LKSLDSHERIQGNPNEGGQDPTHTQTWGKSLANSRRGHRLLIIGNVAIYRYTNASLALI